MRGLLAVLLLAGPAGAAGPGVIAVESGSPLVLIRVLARAGSALDPEGAEGLAALTAGLLVEGSFGDPAAPTTKEKLAELVLPWGARALPSVSVGKEAAVFSMAVPREVLPEYVEKVLRPMFTRPLFEADELERLRQESLQALRSGLRLEQLEGVGLAALDNWLHEGTRYAHPTLGTERGLLAATGEGVRSFYRTGYAPDRLELAVSGADPASVALLREALRGAGRLKAPKLKAKEAAPPPAVRGRQALVVALPNAIATGIHAGFPIEVGRGHPDYWPLYLANVRFGTHRDGFSLLYRLIREQRGYNYGDYSYIEHFEGRPHHLFPPPNFPRRHSYFSIWIRPVAHEHAPHIARALAWELERLVRDGLTEEDCEAARKKAKILYLSLAETSERLLAYRLDDAFHGLEPGYLEGYLEAVEKTTCEQVNAAVRRHLDWKDLKLVFATDDEAAAGLVKGLLEPGPVYGKQPADYQVDSAEKDGKKVYELPEDKLELLRRDAAWAQHRLELGPDQVRVVPVEKLFVTPDVP